MDNLDRAIAEKRRERDETKAALDRLAVELAMLEHAATLRPAVTPATGGRGGRPTHGGARRSSGRQPGSISAEWQAVLRKMYGTGKLYAYGDIAVIASEQGLTASMSSVRDRVRSLARSGLLEGDPDGFAVSAVAAQRFGFDNVRGVNADLPL